LSPGLIDVLSGGLFYQCNNPSPRDGFFRSR